MRDLAGVSISSAAFQRLSTLCRSDASFPRTWDQWQHLLRLSHMEALKRGSPSGELPIDVDDFERWCFRVEIIPCIDALRAYALVRRMKHAGGAGEDPDGGGGPVDRGPATAPDGTR